MTDERYLLDANILIALTSREHVHNARVRRWFIAAEIRRWSVCAFSEAGLLRYLTAPHLGGATVGEAAIILRTLTRHPGYTYLPITADWDALSAPFLKWLHGSKQITDAYLLGLAIHHNLVLVTMDKAFLHLAGTKHRQSVLLLDDIPA